MSERWKKQARAYDCIEGDTLTQMPDGSLMVSAEISVDDETLGRMLQGYICIMCLEPQEVPFPDKCPLCGYRISARQLHDLSTRRGALKEVWVGTRIKKEDEIARMGEIYDFEKRTGIVLPDSVRFPQGPL